LCSSPSCFDRCPDRALDTHIYQAWRDPDSRIGFYNDACGRKGAIAEMERQFGPIIVGEWSLATDNCAMWLNGFNDNLPGFPRLPCKYVPCTDPYMGEGQPGAPVDPTKAIQGPYGTGMSGPIFGYCPVGRDWLKESSGNPQTGRDWVRSPPDAPKHADDTDNVMTHLAYKKINAFSNVGHGFYFWNFRTDLDEPHWSYILALERGWIPKFNLNDDKILNACNREDSGEFKCVLKNRNEIQESSVKGALEYIIKFENKTDTPEGKEILSKKGDALMDVASELVPEFFEQNRGMGATCDFGGIAMLVEFERNITDDDSLGWTDDEYFPEIVTVYRGPNTFVLVLIIIVASILGSIAGFLIAMRTSKKFNRRVRESVMFKPLAGSKNSLVRKSFALPELDNYDELAYLIESEDRKQG
jgi:glucan 1,3-beta-glucosidase